MHMSHSQHIISYHNSHKKLVNFFVGEIHHKITKTFPYFSVYFHTILSLKEHYGIGSVCTGYAPCHMKYR